MRAELQNHADAYLGIDGKIKSERRPAGANPLATFALTQTTIPGLYRTLAVQNHCIDWIPRTSITAIQHGGDSSTYNPALT